ncbi:unnamed protein product [Ostreobium quekettii]|uniref:Uncharacterized protein n=1 Tax=Ostreobium quekettii TaxID=121088 RepID=A0A8S1IKY1_9CHLO|nr:unnamed protein product [Ostreobium quekettii]
MASHLRSPARWTPLGDLCAGRHRGSCFPARSRAGCAGRGGAIHGQPAPRGPPGWRRLPVKPVVADHRGGTGCHASAAHVGSLSKRPGGQQDGWAVLERVAEVVTTLFPVWVCLGVAVGITRPSAVTWFTSDLFTSALGFLMLSMGLTMTFQDFKNCARRPLPVIVGFFAQYLVKPMLGFALARALHLSPALATGLILVACCPGGQSSNVATYIANGDVALSVLMTTASTIGAILMTPLLTKLLAGTLVPVDAMGLALSTLQVVLVPTLVGVMLNELAHETVRKITPILPVIGVALTTILTASPVGQSAAVLKLNGLKLVLPVFLLHALAFPLGYILSRLSHFPERECRTVSIETGMQSSALGFLLAQRHFNDPLVMVPSAVSVLFQAGLGSALAVFWRNLPVRADSCHKRSQKSGEEEEGNLQLKQA